MKQCPFCAGAIADDATLCKHCKQALPSPRVAAPTAAAAPVRRSSGFVWIGGMGLGAFLVIGIVGLMAFRARPAKSGLEGRLEQLQQELTAARAIANKKEDCANPAAVADA